MNKFLLLSATVIMLTFTGCARYAQIIIDPRDNNMEHYQADLAECRQIAEQIESKVAEGALGGAIVGAIVGGIIGGRDTSVTTAQLGALSGGLEGGVYTIQERTRVVKNCLRNRGYRILN